MLERVYITSVKIYNIGTSLTAKSVYFMRNILLLSCCRAYEGYARIANKYDHRIIAELLPK